MVNGAGWLGVRRLFCVLFQLPGRGVNGVEKLPIGARANQFVIVIVHGHLGMMQVTLERKYHVRFTLAFPIQKLADLGKLRLKLLQLRWSQFYLPSRVCDLHGTTSEGPPTYPTLRSEERR